MGNLTGPGPKLHVYVLNLLIECGQRAYICPPYLFIYYYFIFILTETMMVLIINSQTCNKSTLLV